MCGLYCYLLILRAKAGEFSAVRSLSPAPRSHLTPLFDVTIQGIGDTKAVDTYLEQRAADVVRAWGTTRPVYVDAHDLLPDLRTPSGAAPIAYLFDVLRRHGALAIPVTGTTADRGVDYQRRRPRLPSPSPRTHLPRKPNRLGSRRHQSPS